MFICCMKHEDIVCVHIFVHFYFYVVFVSAWLSLDNRMHHLLTQSEKMTQLLSITTREQCLLRRQEGPVTADQVKCPFRLIFSRTRTWLTFFANPFLIRLHGYTKPFNYECQTISVHTSCFSSIISPKKLSIA